MGEEWGVFGVVAGSGVSWSQLCFMVQGTKGKQNFLLDEIVYFQLRLVAESFNQQIELSIQLETICT